MMQEWSSKIVIWVRVHLQGPLWLYRERKLALNLKLHRLLVLEELLLGCAGLLVINFCHILLNVLPFYGLLSLDWQFWKASFASLAAFACQR